MNKGLKISAYICAFLILIGTIYAGFKEDLWIAPIAYILMVLGFTYIIRKEIR